jgi:predicted  nucleic acid-binding Zn-ribbon protein
MITQELWDTFRKLAALEARTEDVLRRSERVEDRVEHLLERIARLEAQFELVRESLRNEILADVKAEVAIVKLALTDPADGRWLRGLGDGNKT